MGVASLPSSFADLKAKPEAFFLRLLSNGAKTGIAKKVAKKLRVEGSSANGVSTEAKNIKTRFNRAGRGFIDTAAHNSKMNAAKELSGEEVRTATKRIKIKYSLGTISETDILA